MKNSHWTATLIFTLFLTSANASNPQTEQIQLSNCLASHMSSKYRVLAENKDFKIVELPAKDLDNLVLLADKVGCGRFLNVSEQLTPISNAVARKDKAQAILLESNKQVIPAEESFSITQDDQVIDALKKINLENIQSSIIQLSDFYNRASTEQTGVDAQNWIQTSFQNLVEKTQRTDTAIQLVNTGPNYMQKSVVAVVGKNIQAPAIVIGAHMDTLSGRMPGADDDATGSATVMEIAKVFLESNFTLRHPVYFVWYAAEEKGLVGSQRVVNYFANKRIRVRSVLQLDMTGYRADPTDPTMWLITDYTSPNLNRFLEQLIREYIGVPVGKTQCGYACSDHASWTKKGISAAFPAETSFEDHNPSIHSVNDTIEHITPEHLLNYAKLGLAFAMELAL